MARALRAKLGLALRHAARVARRRPAVSLATGTKLLELGDTGKDVFFGYYDTTPFGPQDRLVLAVRRPAAAGGQAAGSSLELGVYDLEDPRPSFRGFAESTAWCWQQACRLQWWRDGEDRCVLYNRSRNGRHEAVVQDIETGTLHSVFDRAFYSVTGDGRWAASLNFARLQRLRPGYGYDDIEDPFESDVCPAADGLWLVDLESGESRLLLSLAEIAADQPVGSMQGAKHYFNHLLWSPGGSRLFFLHLWQTPQGRRYSRAFVWEMATGKPRFLGAKDHFSHHWWVDEDRLLAYSTHGDTGRQYHLYDIPAGTRQTLSPAHLTEDGHPSVSPANSRLMVTDTYPDRSLEQHLLLFDMVGKQLLRLGRFFSPPKFRGEKRCDLHPRWSRLGNRIAFDSAHRGERRLCVLEIDALLQASDLSP